jgi:hypothetical protein
LRALLGSGWGRAAAVALALLLVLVLSGALATFFYRPYGHDVRGQIGVGNLGLRVAAASALRLVHLGAALGFTGAVVALVLLGRPWKRGGPGPARSRLFLVAVAAAALLTTGLLTPWDRLLPWSPAVGANMARPMPLGQPGPFPELVGVNARYDEALFAVARWRFGARAAGRVYFAHVIGLPLLTVGAAVILWRRRKRA